VSLYFGASKLLIEKV